MNTKYTEDRPFESQACIAFVGLSVVTATLGFWAKGWLPGMLLTVAMVVIVFLLSRAVERVMEAWETKNYATAVIAGVLGVGFGCIEAGLNHVGLEHLNAEYALAPDWALWPACFFISLVNVFASFGFARAMKDHRQEQPNPARQLADLRWKGKKAA
jgi:ethanolamine transporter EutH